jgi:hypothetical protein
MKINGLRLHRKLSWLVAIFSLMVFIIVGSRKFLENYAFYPILHLGIEWILIGLLIVHCILSQKYLKLWFPRIFKGLKNERARPIYVLRLVQLITNRVIIILASLVVLSGFGYYKWYEDTIGIIIPFEVHVYYDFSLLICIIIHIAVGFKFMFMRRKISHWSSSLFIIALSSSFIVVITVLTFLV